MAGSGGGISDKVEIRIPEWETRTIAEWVALFPPCPECGAKLINRDFLWAAKKGGWKPKRISCPTRSCAFYKKGGFKEDEW